MTPEWRITQSRYIRLVQPMGEALPVYLQGLYNNGYWKPCRCPDKIGCQILERKSSWPQLHSIEDFGIRVSGMQKPTSEAAFLNPCHTCRWSPASFATPANAPAAVAMRMRLSCSCGILLAAQKATTDICTICHPLDLLEKRLEKQSQTSIKSKM